jgi:hypothetical protein
MKGTILKVLAVLLIVYGGVYAYVWIATKWELDKVSAQLAPIATLTHGRVSTSLQGTIAIHDVEITPVHSYDSVHIDKVKVKTPGLLFIVFGDIKDLRYELPEVFGFEAVSMRINRRGSIFQKLAEMKAKDAVVQTRKVNANSCTLKNLFGLDMGLVEAWPEELVIHFNAELRKGDSADSAILSFSSELEQVERVAGQVTLANLDSMPAFRSGDYSFGEFVLDYRMGEGYLDKAKALCAVKSGMSKVAFETDLLEQTDQAYLQDLGIVPGADMRKAIAGVLRGAQLRMEGGFGSFMRPEYLEFYKPEELVELLNLKVFVDNEPVRDLSFTSASAVESTDVAKSTKSPESRPLSGVGLDEILAKRAAEDKRNERRSQAQNAALEAQNEEARRRLISNTKSLDRFYE